MKKAVPTKNYYRIRVTDVNGSAFYNKVLVAGDVKSGFEVRAITNHYDDIILHLKVIKDQVVQMKIVGADGSMVYSESKIVTAGTDWMRIESGNMSTGLYTLQVCTNDGELIKKTFAR